MIGVMASRNHRKKREVTTTQSMSRGLILRFSLPPI
jgi:hypothetical protein